MPGMRTSAPRNASCELPVASIRLASPRSVIAMFSASAAESAAAAASVARSSCISTRIDSNLNVVVSFELREPSGRGVQQVVCHVFELFEVDAARQRVEHHRFYDLGP